jgi:hypothetical protein
MTKSETTSSSTTTTIIDTNGDTGIPVPVDNGNGPTAAQAQKNLEDARAAKEAAKEAAKDCGSEGITADCIALRKAVDEATADVQAAKGVVEVRLSFL